MTEDQEHEIRERMKLAADGTPAEDEQDADCRRCNGSVSWEDDVPELGDRLCNTCAYDELAETRADLVLVMATLDAARDELEATKMQLADALLRLNEAQGTLKGVAAVASRLAEPPPSWAPEPDDEPTKPGE